MARSKGLTFFGTGSVGLERAERILENPNFEPIWAKFNMCVICRDKYFQAFESTLVSDRVVLSRCNQAIWGIGAGVLVLPFRAGFRQKGKEKPWIACRGGGYMDARERPLLD